jgi:hypothetical protein
MQPLVGDQFGRFRALGTQLGLPLRNRRRVFGCVPASGSVAAHLTRDSGGISTNGSSDLAEVVSSRRFQPEFIVPASPESLMAALKLHGSVVLVGLSD